MLTGPQAGRNDCRENAAEGPYPVLLLDKSTHITESMSVATASGLWCGYTGYDQAVMTASVAAAESRAPLHDSHLSADQPQRFNPGAHHPVLSPTGSGHRQLDPFFPWDRQSCGVTYPASEAETPFGTLAVTPVTLHRRMTNIRPHTSPHECLDPKPTWVTPTNKIASVPGPLLLGERSPASTERNRDKPWLNVAQRRSAGWTGTPHYLPGGAA